MTDHPEQPLDMVREDFEAWGDSRQPRSLRSSVTNDYHYPLGNLAFEVWQAATQHSAARIAELEAEVQALRMDAERWRWLRSKSHYLYERAWTGGHSTKKDSGVDFLSLDEALDALDAAMDAAIEAERGDHV